MVINQDINSKIENTTTLVNSVIAANALIIKKEIVVCANEMYPSSQTVPTVTAATLGVYTLTGMAVVTYAAKQDQNANVFFNVPKEYLSGARFKLVYAPSTTSTLLVCFAPLLASRSLGSNVVLTEILPQQIIAAGTLDTLKETGWFTPTTTLKAGDLVAIRLTRLGKNSSDTYTGAINVFAFVFEYNAYK
jgi:hypothetical protein